MFAVLLTISLLPATPRSVEFEPSLISSEDCISDAAISRVSVTSSGAQGDDSSFNPSITADGSTAAFSSFASTLVPGDTNETSDAFVRDLDGGTVERVSVDVQGGEANARSASPRISGDGDAVAYSSAATNLLGGDPNEAIKFFGANNVALPPGMLSVSTSETVEAWFRTDAPGPILGYATLPDGPSTPNGSLPVLYVGADGRLRGQFRTGAANPLVSGSGVDDNAWHHVVLTSDGTAQQLYVDGALQDNRAGAVNHSALFYVLVGRAHYTSAWPQSGGTGWRSFDGHIDEVSVTWAHTTAQTANQHYQARTNDYFNTVLGDNPDGYWRLDEPPGENTAADSSGNDGRFGAITGGLRGEAGALSVDSNGEDDIYVRDRSAEATERVSVASSGEQAVGSSDFPSIDGTGEHVTFFSNASNLVAATTNGFGDVYVHDRGSGQTTLVSVASDGTPANDLSLDASMSADGRYVAFQSWGSNLVSGDTNGRGDIFVHDRDTGATTRVSIASSGGEPNDDSHAPHISADGRYVTFFSWATNLVPGDTNGIADVFIHDTATGDTERLSVNDGGTQGNAFSADPSVSDDGRYVAYRSSASNLVAGDTNGAQDIFLRDRLLDTTTMVSVNADGTQANGSSETWEDGSISADGTRVVFDSAASNLVDDDTNGEKDVYVADSRFFDPDSLIEFIDLWVPRLEDSQFLADFLALPEIPLEILDEGFHDLLAPQQRLISSCLAQALDLVGPDDNPEAIGELLYRVVFLQEDLADLVPEIVPNPDVADLVASALPDSLLPADLIAALNEFGIEDVLPIETVTSQVSDLVESAVGATVDDIPADIQGTLADLEAALADPIDEVTSLVDDISADLPLDEVANVPLDVVNTVGGLIGALDYRVCRTYEAQPEPRQPQCNTSVLGVPTLFDLSGDGVADVTANLLPNILGPWTGGLTLEGSVSRLPEVLGADQGPLEAKVWFETDDLQGNRTTFGFDGLERGDHLGDGSTLLANLRPGADGSLDLRFQVSHSGGSVDEWALIASHSRAGGGFTLGSTQLSPRTAVNGQITLGADGTWAVTADPTQPTVADVEFRTEQPSGGTTRRFDAHLLIDEIGDQVDIGVDTSESDLLFTIISTGTAAADNVEMAMSNVPDIAAPGNRDEIRGGLRGLGGTVALAVDQRADLLISKGGAPIDDMAVTVDRHLDNEVDQSFAGRAADVPNNATIAVATGDATDIGYSASSEMSLLDIAYFGGVPGGDLEDRIDLSGQFTQLPPAFTANLEESAISFDAPESPLGAASIQLARNETQVPVLSGDHVNLRTGSDTAAGHARLAASLRTSGLQNLSVEAGDTSMVDVTTNPGGQSFEAHADIMDDSIGDRHLLSAAIDALPPHASVAFDAVGGAATYEGDPIGSVTAFYQRPGAGPTVSADLSDVPERVNASWAITPDRVDLTLDTIRADGSPAPTTPDLRANVLVSPDGSGGDAPVTGSYVQMGAKAFPSRAGITFDRAERYGRWQASGDTGELVVSIHDLVGADWALRGALEQIPADWDISWGVNHGRFRALNGGSIGFAELSVTNTGSVAGADGAGPFLAARFNETACDVEAALRLTNVSHVEFWGGPEQPGATPGDHGGSGRCFDGLGATGSSPVFDTAVVPDPGDNTVPAATCTVDLSGHGVTLADATGCVRADVDLGGQDLAVDLEWNGSADEHGSSGELRRHLAGTIADLPGSVAVVRAGDTYAYAGSGNPGLKLQFDMGWAAALDTLPTDDDWEYGIHAYDAACDAQTCRVMTPTGAESPLCIDEDEATETERADRCLGVRIRAWLDGLPSAVLVDLSDYKLRAEIFDLFDGTTRNSIIATATLDHMWDEPVALRIRQLGVTPGTDLRFGPITWLRCDDARGPVTDIEIAADARCTELEADDPNLYTQPEGEVLSTDGYRMAIATQHSGPLGSLTVQGRIGDADSLERELSASVRIPSVPADLDIEVNFGQRSMIRSATAVDGIHLFARCMDDSQPDWSPTTPGTPDATAAVSLTEVPSNMVLVVEALPADPDGNPDPGPQAETLYRFPHCSEIFPETDYQGFPDQDPASVEHLGSQFEGGCLIDKTMDLSNIGSGNETGSSIPMYVVRYEADADTLDGWFSTSGPFGLDVIDPRAATERGPNLRLDANRVSFGFTDLRNGAEITLADDKSLLFRQDVFGRIADEFIVGADLRVRTQECTVAIELNGGVKRVQISGTFGLDIGFGSPPPQAGPGGFEVRLVNPGNNLKLATSKFFVGFGLGRGEEPGGGDYDRFEFKLQAPRFRYGIDLEARVEFGIISDVKSFDLVLTEEHNSLYIPKFGTDGDTEEIVDQCLPGSVSVELHGDPTITEHNQTANEIVIQPDAAYDSQGFVLLPMDGPQNPNGEYVDEWIINTLGATVFNPNPGGDFRTEIRWKPIACATPIFA